MKKKYRLLLLLMLTGLVLAASVTLSEAEDTYNFYFQKAPGPVTVNQGTTGQSTHPQTAPVVQPDGTMTPAASGAAPVSVAKEGPAETNYNRWELYAGFTMPYSSDGSQIYYDRYNEPLSSQYVIGLQYNFNENVGAFGEYTYLSSVPVWPTPEGTRSDWALGGNFTPIHIRPFSSLSLNLSGNAGVMSSPFIRFAPDISSANLPPVQHKIMPFLGVRASLHIARRVAINANARALTGFNKLQTGLTASYFF